MSMGASIKPGMFRKIHQSEKKRMVIALAEHRTALVIRGADDDIFNMMSDGAEGEKLLKCRIIFGGLLPDKSQSVVVNFTFGYEKYFFRGEMTLAEGKFFVNTDSDFYILQRRKAARLVMPAEFPCGFNLIEHRSKNVFYELKIIDFSSGGVKVWFPLFEPEFVTGEVIKGVIHLGIRRPLNMDGTVRHVIRQESGDRTGQVFGVQFDAGNKIMEVKLLTMFMDLQREIFLKYSK